MSNNYFKFKNFTIHQDHCAMKVGTDGTLLGAWAHGGQRILDVGTGSGLIALMMAQRFPTSSIKAIDISHEACIQANENIQLSPFSQQIAVEECSFQQLLDNKFNAIVSNPPFFINSLRNHSSERSLARHAETLSYADLFLHTERLLANDGEFSAIIPIECYEQFNMEAILHGFSISRICTVVPRERHPPKRYLIAYHKHKKNEIEITSLVIGSEAYHNLVANFYL